MKVYRIKRDYHFQYFLPEDEADWDKLQMDCMPKAGGWSPPPVFIYEPKLKPGDFYNFGGDFLITNARATEALRDYLEMAGELLPLPYQGELYTVLNVTECINCLDQAKTEWVVEQESQVKVWIKKYVFHPDRFSESRLFKIPETDRGEILLSRVARRCRQ